MGIHQCISIARAGWEQSLPRHLFRCFLLCSRLVLRAHHDPSTLSPLTPFWAVPRGESVSQSRGVPCALPCSESEARL